MDLSFLIYSAVDEIVVRSQYTALAATGDKVFEEVKSGDFEAFQVDFPDVGAHVAED